MARFIAALDEAGFGALETAKQEDYTKMTAGPKVGTYVLNVDKAHGFEVDDVAGLKSSLGEERKNRERFEGEAGSVRAQLETATKRVTDLEALDPEKDADKIANVKFEAMRGGLVTQHETALATEKTRADNYLTGLRTALIRQEATTEIVGLVGKPKWLLDPVCNQCRLKEGTDADGVPVFTVEVLDGNQTPRIGNSAGDLFTIKQLVAEMQADPEWADAFDGTKETGAGRVSDVGLPRQQQQQGEKTSQEKIRDGLAKL